MPNFGFESIGADWQSLYPTNAQALGNLSTLSEDGTINSMTAYVGQDSGSGYVKYIIVKSDNTIVGQTDTVALGSYAWVKLYLTTPYVAVAGNYFLFIWQSGSSASYTKKTDDVGLGWMTTGDISGQWPTATSIATGANANSKSSIYATYTAGGGVSVPLTGVSG